MSSSNSYIKNKFSLTSLLAERLIERVVEELWREMKKIELIMKHLLANIGKMSNSYFLSNISYGRGQSMNKIFNSHHFILNKNLKGMMVMVNIGAKEEGSC